MPANDAIREQKTYAANFFWLVFIPERLEASVSLPVAYICRANTVAFRKKLKIKAVMIKTIAG